MKKILIALAVLLSVQVADAQVKSPADSKKAVEAAEAASQNPKKAVKVATWTKLAGAYVEAFNAPAGNAWIGAGQQELSLIMGSEKPSATETVELMGEPFTKMVYADKNFYFNGGGVLQIIEITNPVYEDALDRAYDAYLKALEVDVKKSKTSDIIEGIKGVASKYLEAGMTYYMLGDLKTAGEDFAKAAEFTAAEPVSSVDTTAAYNAGFAAWSLQNYEKAKKFFQMCIDAGYFYEDGEVYAKISDCYSKLGDMENARLSLEKGFQAYPQSQSILIGLINFYIESGDNPERLFTLLDEAKKNEPGNASLYYVEGNIYNQLGNQEKAVEAYRKSHEINPEYEFGLIGIGILYYNQAIDLQEKAQAELDDTKYMALVSEFETALRNAIEPFESAYNVSKVNEIKVNIAEYLKNIYYRFREESADFMAKYEKYNEVVATGNPL